MQVGATERGGPGRFNEANGTTESSLLAAVSTASSNGGAVGEITKEVGLKTGSVTDRVDPEVQGKPGKQNS